MRELTPPSVAASDERRADPLAVAVAASVSELRKKKGLSERAAARLLQTSQTQLRRMEDPRYLPSLRSLSRLALAYGYRLRVEFESPDGPAPDRARPSAEPARPRPSAPARSNKAKTPTGRGRRAPQRTRGVRRAPRRAAPRRRTRSG